MRMLAKHSASVTFDMGEAGELNFVSRGSSEFNVLLGPFFVGEQGEQGPPGPGAQIYQHDQVSPATEWIVNHNFDRFPAIEVLNSAGRLIEAEVLHMSPNQARVIFNQPLTGKAIAR